MRVAGDGSGAGGNLGSTPVGLREAQSQSRAALVFRLCEVTFRRRPGRHGDRYRNCAVEGEGCRAILDRSAQQEGQSAELHQ